MRRLPILRPRLRLPCTAREAVVRKAVVREAVVRKAVVRKAAVSAGARQLGSPVGPFTAPVPRVTALDGSLNAILTDADDDGRAADVYLLLDGRQGERVAVSIDGVWAGQPADAADDDGVWS